MDELNDLKQAWEAFSDVSSKKQYSTEELKQIVKKQSKNELQKIQRKLLLEWGVAILISFMMVVVVSMKKPSDTIYALLFVGVILGVSFIPYFKVFKLRMNQNNHLKMHLNLFLNAFNNLVTQYIRMSTMLIPIAGLGGFLLGFHSTAGQETWLLLFTTPNIIILVVTVIVISIGGNWFQRRYFNWVYGKNISRLQKCLADLDEVAD